MPSLKKRILCVSMAEKRGIKKQARRSARKASKAKAAPKKRKSARAEKRSKAKPLRAEKRGRAGARKGSAGPQKLSDKSGPQTLKIESEGKTWSIELPDWNETGPLKKDKDGNMRLKLGPEQIGGLKALYEIGCTHKMAANALGVPWLVYRGMLRRSAPLKRLARTGKAKAGASVMQSLFRAITNPESPDARLAIPWLERFAGLRAPPKEPSAKGEAEAPNPFALITGNGAEAGAEAFKKAMNRIKEAESPHVIEADSDF